MGESGGVGDVGSVAGRPGSRPRKGRWRAGARGAAPRDRLVAAADNRRN
jgi:hypothetical protein